MAVLIEAISVVVRRSVIETNYPGGWDAFAARVPNATLCADENLARIGFMTPPDVKSYVDELAEHGITYFTNGAAKDLVVVDQHCGPVAPCHWIEFDHVELAPDTGQRVAVCRIAGDTTNFLATPDTWVYGGSLSHTYCYVPIGEERKSLRFLRHENGLDVYFNKMTGKEVFVGRTIPGGRKTEEIIEYLNRIGKRLHQLEAEAGNVWETGYEKKRMVIYEELNKLCQEASGYRTGEGPTASVACHIHGFALRLLGRWEEGEMVFREMTSIKPNNLHGWLELTYCLGMQGKTTEAEATARKSVELSPESAAAWGNLASTLIESGKKEEAKTAIMRAISLDPNDLKNRYIFKNIENRSGKVRRKD